jgi:putative peptide zinc metalloprotease protein
MSALWARIAEYGTHIAEVPIGEIQAQLAAFEQEILQIVEKDQGPLGPVQVATSPTGSAAEPTAPAAPTAGPDPSGAPPAATTEPAAPAVVPTSAPPEGAAPTTVPETEPTDAAVEAPSTVETAPPSTSPAPP